MLSYKAVLNSFTILLNHKGSRSCYSFDLSSTKAITITTLYIEVIIGSKEGIEATVGYVGSSYIIDTHFYSASFFWVVALAKASNIFSFTSFSFFEDSFPSTISLNWMALTTALPP